MAEAKYCSFCGKSRHEVKHLVTNGSVYICNECVDLCIERMAGDLRDAQAPKGMHEAAVNAAQAFALSKADKYTDPTAFGKDVAAVYVAAVQAASEKLNEPSWSDSQVAEGRPGFFEAQQETAPQEALQAQATGLRSESPCGPASSGEAR